jgi:hypothetical protein
MQDGEIMQPRNLRLLPLSAFISIGVLFGSLAQAGVAVFVGEAGEKLFIQDAPKIGANAALVKFEGIESPWAGHVIQVEKTKAASGQRYSFEYDLGLSGPKQMRQYQIVVESGSRLVKGTSAKRVELFVQGKKGATEMVHDRDLTMSSQMVDLVAEQKKSPFKPEVD